MPPKTGVVLLPATPPPPSHEQASHRVIATMLAEVLGIGFLGDYPPQDRRALYFVPTDTLIGDESKALGITGINDLFGGAVGHPFMATKAITHGLLTAGTTAPAGWCSLFAEQVHGAVLTGFTVFDVEDALNAGCLLLELGDIRLKPVRGKAGRGQVMIRNRKALERYLADVDRAELAVWGLVLEENLTSVVTCSVGQVRVADLIVSYYGTQRLTHDNNGEEVYGGSDLTLVRGDYESLDRLPLDDRARLAVKQAKSYESAACYAYPSLFASRRNYDVAQGTDSRGHFRSGVLEQSWRIGGASGAEVLALRAFAGDAALQCVVACTLETYGESELPHDATLLFQGHDENVGFINKSARILAYDCAQ